MKRHADRELVIEHRGFGASGLLTAFVVGAAAGAAWFYLSSEGGEERRQRLRELSEGARETLGRVPSALRKAGEAAREAFNRTVSQSLEDAKTSGAVVEASAPAAPFSG